MRQAYLDNIFSFGDCRLDCLRDCLDGIDQDLASATPDEDVLCDFLQVLEPGLVGHGWLVIFILFRTP